MVGSNAIGPVLLRVVRNIDAILVPLEHDTRRPDDKTLNSIRAILLNLEQIARDSVTSSTDAAINQTLRKEIAQRLKRLDTLASRPRGVMIYGDIEAE